MTTLTDLGAIMTAAGVLLGIAGGMLRYVMRITSTMERTGATAESVVQQFGEHVTKSVQLHGVITERLALHDKELAVLTTRVDALAAGAER